MWKLDGTHALIQHANTFAARLQLQRPQQGFVDPTVDTAPVAGQYLATRLNHVDGEIPIEEAYVRGNDLFVQYQAVGPEQIRLSIYYRWWNLADIDAAIELIVSLETPQLDTQPQAWIGNRRPGASVQSLPGDKPPYDAVALTDADRQFALIGHPQSGSELTTSENAAEAEVRAELKTQHLEKGVIRGARVLGVWFTGSPDHIEPAVAAHREFVRSELPLTV